MKVQSEKVKEVLDSNYATPRLTDEGEKPPLEEVDDKKAKEKKEGDSPAEDQKAES